MPSKATIRWKEGKILFPSEFWKLPTKRRLPRLLIEDRANEVGILIYIDEPWVIFEETTFESETIKLSDDTQTLELYQRRYQLIPKKYKRQNTYDWLKKPANALLLWGKENKYFIKSSKI